MGTLLGVFCLAVVVLLIVPGAILVAMHLQRTAGKAQDFSLRKIGPRRCPTCEADLPRDAPEGLCPRCLLQQALSVVAPSPIRGRRPESTPAPRTFAAPGLADLAPRFPQLEILDLLGQGGMGAVYKARHAKLDRIVALKILPPETKADSSFAERFTREARALAKLSHPNIVGVHDFGEADGQFYLLMEYVDGVNLRQLMLGGRVQPEEALRIVSQICDALQYAHDEGVVHRDIKPENILIDQRGRVKIADFGLAKLLNRTPADFTLTATHQVMGTPHYMAPEQIERPQTVDHRADIYSLGVVFYEMLTGELPMGRFALPSLKAGADERLDEIVLRALEKDPERRYQRVSELKSDLGTLGSGLPVSPASVLPALSHQEEIDQEMLRLHVKMPAVGLILTGIMGLLFWTIMGVFFVAIERKYWTYDPTRAYPWDTRESLGGDLLMGTVIALALGLAMSLLVAGARSMMRFQRFELAMMASVWAMLPWSGPGILLGVPFGLWALFTLHNPKVKAGFVQQAVLAKRRQARNLLPLSPAEYEMIRLEARGPALGLVVTAVAGCVHWIVMAILFITAAPNSYYDSRHNLEIAIPVVGAGFLSAGFVLFGARRLMRLENHGFVFMACVWAMIPWSVAFPLGLLMGFLALLFLRRPEVKRAFLYNTNQATAGFARNAPTGPVRGKLRSVLGGIQSLFLGSRLQNPSVRSEGRASAISGHQAAQPTRNLPSPQSPENTSIELFQDQTPLGKEQPTSLAKDPMRQFISGLLGSILVAIVCFGFYALLSLLMRWTN